MRSASRPSDESWYPLCSALLSPLGPCGGNVLSEGELFIREAVISAGHRDLCEDHVGLLGGLAFVIDGATQLGRAASLPPSPGTWIADLVQRDLSWWALERSYREVDVDEILPTIA